MVPFFHVGVTLSWKCAAALHASVVEGLSCARAFRQLSRVPLCRVRDDREHAITSLSIHRPHYSGIVRTAQRSRVRRGVRQQSYK